MKFPSNKSNAMSPIGYVIALIIFIGVGMIISAPFIVDNSDSNNKELENINRNYERSFNNINDFETKINNKIENIENQLNSLQEINSKSNKYTCTIEGKVDENGDIVPLDSVLGNKKFVFVCEYNY